VIALICVLKQDAHHHLILFNKNIHHTQKLCRSTWGIVSKIIQQWSTHAAILNLYKKAGIVFYRPVNIIILKYKNNNLNVMLIYCIVISTVSYWWCKIKLSNRTLPQFQAKGNQITNSSDVPLIYQASHNSLSYWEKKFRF